MAARVSSPRFVGRRDELDVVGGILDRARAGEPGVVLIGGEAGVGKTRFVRQLAAAASDHDWRVLEGGCVQVGDEGLPFGPFVEALRALWRRMAPRDVEHLVGAGRAELARLMPQLLTTETATGPATFVPDASAQGRLFEHLLLFLDRLAAATPLLLIVEDAHWADRSTLELLGFLSRNLRDAPIVVLVTFRSDELHRRHPLLPFLAEQERAGRARRFELRRFDRDELAAQIEGILGGAPGADLVTGILSRSQGNPFYAEELLAAGSQRGGRLPDTVRDVLLARVATLSDPTQRVVRVAAAGGARVSPAILELVTGVGRDAIDAALEEAVSRNVLVPLEDAPDERYAFRHALVQEAVYGELLAGERSRLHRAYAAALGDVLGDAAGTAELAYHAQASHDLPRAFDAWIAAGLSAEAMYALAEAAADYDRALDLWDQVSDADARSPVDRIDLLVRAALVAEGTAPERSVDYIRAAIARVDAMADPTRAGLLYERLGHQLGDVGFDGATEAYEEAVRLVPADPPTLARARVLAGLGTWRCHTDRCAEARDLCAAAIAVARAVGGEEISALPALGAALIIMGQVAEGLTVLRDAVHAARRAERPYDLARAQCWFGAGLFFADQFEPAVQALREAATHAELLGFGARWGSIDLAAAGDALIDLGRWDQAAAELVRASRLAAGMGSGDIVRDRVQLLDVLQGRAAGIPGNPADVWGGLYHAAFRAPAEQGLWLGLPLLSREHVRAALAAVADQAQATVRALGWAFFLGLRAEADIAVLARLRGDGAGLAEALRIGGELRARMAALVTEVATKRPYFTPTAQRWATLCAAEESRLKGRHEPDAWAVAAKAMTEPYLQAYARWREGEAALAGPRSDRARGAKALQAAEVIAARLGAEPLRRAIAALTPHAVSGSKDASDPGRRRFSLSPREREVLALLAAGRSDGEIGEALFISRKTASVHVANIKAKLGAASRVEIVVHSIALGLVEAPAGPVPS